MQSDERLPDRPAPRPGDVAGAAIAIVQELAPAIERFADFDPAGVVADATSALADPTFWAELALDLPEYLLLRYLRGYQGVLRSIMRLLGVIGDDLAPLRTDLGVRRHERRSAPDASRPRRRQRPTALAIVGRPQCLDDLIGDKVGLALGRIEGRPDGQLRLYPAAVEPEAVWRGMSRRARRRISFSQGFFRPLNTLDPVIPVSGHWPTLVVHADGNTVMRPPSPGDDPLTHHLRAEFRRA